MHTLVYTCIKYLCKSKRNQLKLHCNFKSCETNVANGQAVNFRVVVVEVSIENICFEQNMPISLNIGILGIKRGRKKDKKSKKSAMGNKDEEPDIVVCKESSAVGSDGEDTQKSAPPTPEVDEEGGKLIVELSQTVGRR